MSTQSQFTSQPASRLHKLILMKVWAYSAAPTLWLTLSDLTENDKPWRQPGADVSDYFNYGFDEFTWALYASKQETLRSEFDTEKIAQNSKKMFEDMNMMMAMGGGMPGMMPGAAPGMEGIPPEMQQMMQQMMSQGMDPSQMDPAMFAGMQGNQTGAGGAGAAQAGQGGFGQGQNSQMGGYGFDQGMEARNRGGNFGRGRGGRRNW
jgi:pre-mRNA 3'-end-processing factor FIP1